MRYSHAAFAMLVSYSAMVHGCRALDSSAPVNRDHLSSNDDTSRHTKQDAGTETDAMSRLDDPPPTQDPKDYATDVLVTAACSSNPQTAAVAKQHQTAALCEHIVMTAARNNDGDFYEVGLPFSWSTADPAIVALSFPLGASNNYALPIGLLDTFDQGGTAEPSTTVTACALNTCPNPRPADCHDQVCATVEVMSTINLENSWTFYGETFGFGLTVLLEQDGWSFRDQIVGLKGNIDTAKVSFMINDNLYTGTITPDRNHMAGQVVDSISLTPLGNWSAVRP